MVQFAVLARMLYVCCRFGLLHRSREDLLLRMLLFFGFLGLVSALALKKLQV